jgi:hypothetical protein
MSKLSFKEFVEQEREVETRKRSIDWEERKKFFLGRLEVLFQDVERFLHDFIESNDVQIIRKNKGIKEEYIGKYEVPVMRIKLYGKHATLIPVGTLMIGTPGRVDLVGTLESKRIILTGKDEYRPQPPVAFSCSWLDEDNKLDEIGTIDSRGPELVWKFITEPTKNRYIDLDKDSFLSLLQEVLDA